MIESSEDNIIRIWNFHSGVLLNKIQLSNDGLFGICLWNNTYLFIGCGDSKIKLIDYKNGKIINDIIGHNNCVVSIKKIIHPIFGECLISLGSSIDQIKIWTTPIKCPNA